MKGWASFLGVLLVVAGLPLGTSHEAHADPRALPEAALETDAEGRLPMNIPDGGVNGFRIDADGVERLGQGPKAPPMVPGSEARVIPLGDCELACTFAIERPTEAAAGISPNASNLYTSDLRLPYPAGDRDGDGVEDIYLLEPLDPFAPTDRIHLQAIDGDTGAPSISYTFDSPWVVPRGVLASTDGRLELFTVARTSSQWETDGLTVVVYASDLVAMDVETGEEVWARSSDARIREDGSGYIEFLSLAGPGPYLPTGVQAISYEGNVTWTDVIFNYTLAELSSSLVETADLSPHWTTPPDGAHPVDVVEDPSGWDLLSVNTSLEGEPTLERRRGSDRSLAWQLPASEAGVEPTFVDVTTVAGTPSILLQEAPAADGLSVGVVSGDGSPVWTGILPGLETILTRVGTDVTTGSPLATGGAFEVNFSDGWVWIEQTMVDLSDGSVRWVNELNETIEGVWWSALFTPVAGDLTGDGASETAFIVDKALEDSSSEHADTCNWSLLVRACERSYNLTVTLISSEHGRPAAEATVREPFVTTMLSFWDPDARLERIPFLITSRTTTHPHTRELTLASYDPADSTFTNTTLDHRTMGAPGYTAYTYGAGLLPLNLFDGPMDEVVAYWYQEDRILYGDEPLVAADPVSQYHARWGTHLVEVEPVEEAWSIESEAPWDLQAWEALDTA